MHLRRRAGGFVPPILVPSQVRLKRALRAATWQVRARRSSLKSRRTLAAWRRPMPGWPPGGASLRLHPGRPGVKLRSSRSSTIARKAGSPGGRQVDQVAQARRPRQHRRGRHERVVAAGEMRRDARPRPALRRRGDPRPLPPRRPWATSQSSASRQAPGPARHIVMPQPPGQQIAAGRAIPRLRNDCHAAVAAPRDMMRNAGDDDAGEAGRGKEDSVWRKYVQSGSCHHN